MPSSSSYHAPPEGMQQLVPFEKRRKLVHAVEHDPHDRHDLSASVGPQPRGSNDDAARYHYDMYAYHLRASSYYGYGGDGHPPPRQPVHPRDPKSHISRVQSLDARDRVREHVHEHVRDHSREPPNMPYPRPRPGSTATSPKYPPAYYPPPPNDPYYASAGNSNRRDEHRMPAYDYPPPLRYDMHPEYHLPSPHGRSPRGAPLNRGHLKPRYNHHHECDQRSYAPEDGYKFKQYALPSGSYASPTSVMNVLDTRSPEGSRNLNNFEERMSGGTPKGPVPSIPPTKVRNGHSSPSNRNGHYQHSPPMYYPHHGPTSPHHEQPASMHHPSVEWLCNYCNHQFSNWEDCSAHESICRTRFHASRSPASKANSSNSNLSSIQQERHLMDDGQEFAQNTDRETFLLATPHDGESLSDRQCYVRTHFVELFIANETDVSARHSRGAQKLHLDQVGLRCAYCVKLKPRDRAERAVCYPSSISRIYQTVADMQRFHFEACVAIPPKVLDVYKILKTTRPRGVGSPQSYWDKSARDIGLVDSKEGIKMVESSGKIAPRRKFFPENGLEVAPRGVKGKVDEAVHSPPPPAPQFAAAPIPLLLEASPAPAPSSLPSVPASLPLGSESLPPLSHTASPVTPDASAAPSMGNDDSDVEIKQHEPAKLADRETSAADASILLMLKKPMDSPKKVVAV